MYCGMVAETIAALPWKMTASWRWYSSQVTLCSLVSSLSSVTFFKGVMSRCVKGGFSILSQLSVGLLATWRILVSSRTRARQLCNPPHILVLRLVATCAISLTSSSINSTVDIALSHGKTAALKRASTMRSTAAPGVERFVLVLMLSCYDNSITTVKQWLLIGKVDNVVIELWVFTCTAAGWPSRQQRGDTMFHVECGNGYLYPRMGL